MKKKWWIVVASVLVVGAAILLLGKFANEESGQIQEEQKKPSVAGSMPVTAC